MNENNYQISIGIGSEPSLCIRVLSYWHQPKEHTTVQKPKVTSDAKVSTIYLSVTCVRLQTLTDQWIESSNHKDAERIPSGPVTGHSVLIYLQLILGIYGMI